MIPNSFNPLGVSNAFSKRRSVKIRFHRTGTSGSNTIWITPSTIVSFKVNGTAINPSYDTSTHFYEFEVEDYKEEITIEIDAGSKYNLYSRTGSWENMNEMTFSISLKSTDLGHSELAWKSGTYVLSNGQTKDLDLDTHFLIRSSAGTKVHEVMHNDLKYASNGISVVLDHDGGYSGRTTDEHLTIYKLNPNYRYDLVLYDYTNGSMVNGELATKYVNPNTGKKYTINDLPIKISADGIIKSGCSVGDFTFNISNDVGPFVPTSNPENNLGLFWHVFRINPGLEFETINRITLENTEDITLSGSSRW